ncbi:MAG: hypothetical protein IT520_06735 [Burkholderiales bacterium]|nr:hypothetical protein [Burkholderiales bacterium]
MASPGRDTSEPPVWVPWLMGALGAAIAAAAVFAPDESVHAPRWLVALCGAIFALGGVLASRTMRQPGMRAVNAFVAATLLTAFAVVGAWVALFAEGPFTTSVGGASVLVGGVAPRIVFGLGTAIVGAVAAHAWRAWWRAVRATHGPDRA